MACNRSNCREKTGKGICGSSDSIPSGAKTRIISATEAIKSLVDPKFGLMLALAQKAGVDTKFKAETAKAHLENLGFEKSEDSYIHRSPNGDIYEATFTEDGRVKCIRHDPSTDSQSDYFADTHYDNLNDFMSEACTAAVIDKVRVENGETAAKTALSNLNKYKSELRAKSRNKKEQNKREKFLALDPKETITATSFYDVLRVNGCKFGDGACLVSEDKLIRIINKSVFLYESDNKGEMPLKEKLPITKETLTRLGLKI